MLSKKLLIVAFIFFFRISDAQTPELVFEELKLLPDKEGFAGMFAGVIGDKILCMGGANFPDQKPWENGIKKWSDAIFIFNGKRWIKNKHQLPLPLA